MLIKEFYNQRDENVNSANIKNLRFQKNSRAEVMNFNLKRNSINIHSLKSNIKDKTASIKSLDFSLDDGTKFFDNNFNQLEKPEIEFFDISGFELPNIHGEVFQRFNNKDQKVLSPYYHLLQPPLSLTDNTQLYKPLWKSQISGIEFLVSNEGALLADDPGLRKTVQVAMALRLLFRAGKIKRALIVVPKSTIGSREISKQSGDARQWEGHLEFWANELKVKTILPAVWEGGRPPAGFSGNTSLDRRVEWMEQAHIYLTTYSLIRNDVNKNIIPLDYFDAVVLDEAHNIKNPNSQQSQAIGSLEAKYKWGLTGTPVQNYPKELYGIFQFLKPEKFPALRYKEYDEITEQQISNATKNYIIRRTKKADDLPPKIRHEHWVDLTQQQKDFYDTRYRIRKQRILDVVRGGANSDQQRKSILGAIQDLKQICNFDPEDFSSNKIQLLKQIIKNAIDTDEKVIVFSQFLPFGIDKIKCALVNDNFNCLELTGGMSSQERDYNIELFKTDNKYNIFLCSLKAGGVGLNLEEASVVIHFDHWWNPALMWQAEDRAHRFGQTKTVKVHSFWTKNTIEEKIDKLLKSKEKMINRLMNEIGDIAVERELEKSFDLDDLLNIFEL